MYREAKGMEFINKRFARELCEYAGVIKDVETPLLPIDRKVFRVMFGYFRTCRVTRLTGNSYDNSRNEKMSTERVSERSGWSGKGFRNFGKV
jgi:hypothetical protein